MTHTELISKLKWRYAVKKFDASKNIPADQWSALEESLVLTPSSYGLQPWKFVLVQNPELRKKLREVSWNQSQVEDCSHYVIMLGKTSMTEADVDHFMQRIHTVRGTPLENLAGFRKGIVGDVVTGVRSKFVPEWAARQVYIALGQAMASAAVLNIDACPMEGIDNQAYDALLTAALPEVMQGYRSLCALAFGYRSADDAFANAKKVRFDAKDIIYHL